MTNKSNTDPNKKYNSRKVEIRMVGELIGLCQGLRASGRIEQSEAEYLRNWFFKNQDLLEHSTYATLIFNQVSDSLELEWGEESARIIFDNLAGVTGDMFALSEEASSADFFTQSVKHERVEPKSKSEGVNQLKVCFTGKHEFGSRSECATAAQNAGFEVVKNICKDLGYLVIGGMGSSSGWVFGNLGAKAEAVLKNQEQGIDTKIVDEPTWLKILEAQSSG